MKKVIPVSFVVILCAATALQAEFQVNTYTNDNQEHPAIAIDPAGNFVVVWESKGQDGSGDGVYGRRFDAAGTALGSEFQINTTTYWYQDDPDVAMDAEGNFVVVWEGPDGDDEGVYARLYSANGQPRTDEFLVNSFTASRQKEPRVAMNESGAFVIVWEYPEPLPAYHVHWHIVGRLYDAAGVPQGTDFEISQLPHAHVPDVAMAESGDFVVAWGRDGDADNPPYEPSVRFRMYSAYGTPKGNAVQITGGNYTYFSSIAMNSSGSFIITWSYHPDYRQVDVYAQRFDPDGNPISAPFMVNTYTTSRQSSSSAAMHDSGELLVAWYSEGQDGSSHGVFGQRYNSADTPFGEEFQLNTYTLAKQWYPDIALSESGRFVVVWQSQGQDGSGYGIFAEFGQLPRQLTYYVDRDATGANNGSSWADAYNDLQDALAATWSGEEIRVAQGIYKPARPLLPPPPPGGGSSVQAAPAVIDRKATFQLKNGVVIKGGYAGFGQPDPNARDIDVYKTILSGDLLGNDEPDFANNGENSYHVVTGSETDETAVVDGFTITGGNANGGETVNSGGGGMFNDSGSPTLLNCTFSHNLAQNSSGGIFNFSASSPTVTNCTFTNNRSGNCGGGMGNESNCNPVVTNCTFSGNEAGFGGGMYNGYSRPKLINCIFGHNMAQNSGGGIFNFFTSSLTLTNCTFSGNMAHAGNALACDSPLQTYPNNLQITNSILWDGVDGIWNNDSSVITISYSDVHGGWPGTGNFNANPLFVDAARDNYHLLADSPCINTGDPDYIAGPNETDLDGRPRIIYGRIDMGAYEFFNTRPVADAGHDQIVECACNAVEGTKVTLDGTGSLDDDGDTLTYTWTGPFVESPSHGATPTITLDGGCPGDYVITLVVNDGTEDSEPDKAVITVVDTTPPDINCPADVTLECPADTTPSTTGKATATDTCGKVTIRSRHRIIPVCGNTEIIERTWTATDECGNSSTCMQIITVVDTTPPVIDCPMDVTLEYPADTNVVATGSATAADTCGDVTIAHSDVWLPGCGNTGTLTRAWTATDECGNSSTCAQTISVFDTTPPEFALSVSPTTLWPPNHKMFLIAPTWTVSDECDTSPDVLLVSIVMNEGDDVIGDGHTSDDIQTGDDGSIYLRAERSGTGSDRVYTITYQAIDDCGNATARSATVTVPHDQR